MPEPPPLSDLGWEIAADGIARMTLNRPQAGNSITPRQREEIIQRMRAASADPAVRVVVLTGAGDRHFCTGADLSAAAPPAAGSPDGMPARPAGSVARAVAGGAQQLVAAVLDCEKPVIAAVNGTAAGIGCHLAYACDLVVAADTAKFVEVFVRRGLVVDGGGAYLLARLVGPRIAKELIFFGDDLLAAEAHRLGLVNRVVPADLLAATVADWAARLATGPTLALGLSKRLVNGALEADRASAFAQEASAAEINMASVDGQEGLRAFVERRAPVFHGW